MARLLLLVGFFLCFVYFTNAYDFYVGVRNGWVLKPAENYNSWAERSRFQVKDKLIFNYKKGEDSVLVVKKEDYDSCNTKNPITKFEDGKSVFVFDRSGPFFFISGADGHCGQGQKLIVVVLAVRNKPIQPPPTSLPPSASAPSPSLVPGTKPPSPAPVVKPPSSSSPSPSPVFVEPPSSSPSPAPVTKPPSTSPTPSPASKPPSTSPSPSPFSPVSPTASPASSPVPSAAKSPSPSSIISPGAPAAGPGASALSPPASSLAPGGGGGVPVAVTPSSNSTSTPASSSPQILSVSRLSYGVLALFLGAVVLF